MSLLFLLFSYCVYANDLLTCKPIERLVIVQKLIQEKYSYQKIAAASELERAKMHDELLAVLKQAFPKSHKEMEIVANSLMQNGYERLATGLVPALRATPEGYAKTFSGMLAEGRLNAQRVKKYFKELNLPDISIPEVERFDDIFSHAFATMEGGKEVRYVVWGHTADKVLKAKGLAGKSNSASGPTVRVMREVPADSVSDSSIGFRREFMDHTGRWRVEMYEPQVSDFLGRPDQYKAAFNEYIEFINSTHIPATNW
jgi:hypothetical protein